MSHNTEQVETIVELPYPAATEGTALLVGAPATTDEPVAFDYLKAILYLAYETNLSLPGKKARIEVHGHMPRRLGQKHGDVLDVLREAAGDPLYSIECRRAAVTQALVERAGLGQLVDVLSFTEKLLNDRSTQAEFKDKVERAKGEFGTKSLVLQSFRGSHAPVEHVLRAALNLIVPDHVLKDAHLSEDERVFYTLVELLRIVQKLQKNIVVFQQPLEQDFLFLAAAYMDRVYPQVPPPQHGNVTENQALVQSLIRVRRGIAGRHFQKAKLVDAPAYRFSTRHASHRVSLYPADDVSKLRKKLLQGNRGPRIDYLMEMFVQALRMLYTLSDFRKDVRYDIIDAIPEVLRPAFFAGKNIESDNEENHQIPYDAAIPEELIKQNADAIIQAVYDLLIAPGSKAITQKLRGYATPGGGGGPGGSGVTQGVEPAGQP